MRTRTKLWLAVLPCAVVLAAAFAVALMARPAAADDSSPARSTQNSGRDDRAQRRGGRQERFLYVTTIAQSATDPDFVAVIGADPRRSDFGKIVNRVDMLAVGDELHHFGYSRDQKRLIVPGLFSNRIHVLDIKRDRKRMAFRAVNDRLATESGYVVPHGVMALRGKLLVPMIGAATDTTLPGGLVEISDRTGAFKRYFGPGPVRDPGDPGPTYMYDFAALPAANRGISSTFGPPATCGGGIDPGCLGDDSAVWLAHDDDRDGVFRFMQVLGPEDGLAIPADHVLSHDNKYLYLTNWFGNTVQQFDVSDPFDPVLIATVSVPHPNMLRLSRDNRRLYVSNSLLTAWDNDPDFGPARNQDYGIWLFDVDKRSGELTPLNADGRAWVSFTDVQKKTTKGPAGPHMMLFDPSVPLEPGEH